MTLEELREWVEELESDMERKVEWTLTDSIPTSQAKLMTQPFYLATRELKEKIDELILIREFNDNI